MIGNQKVKLTDKAVRDLTAPLSGNRITYDGEVIGFGARVTKDGAKSFVMNYTVNGRERRCTIGRYPAWSVAAARDEARRLRQEIDRGIDPLAQREAARLAPTVAELCDRYLDEHATRKRTAASDRAMIERRIKPRFGSQKVAEIVFADVDKFHLEVTRTGSPYAANRLVALLSKMFSLGIRWGMRQDNPAKGVSRNDEERRSRYLSGDELHRLIDALVAHPSQSAANAIRMLLLTGARRGEVLSATWTQFDLETGHWTKPSAHTKQKKDHRVPLSMPARQLLVEMRADAERRASATAGGAISPYLFPGRSGNGPMVDIKTSWASLCRAANLKGVRTHDLRHTYASVLASEGLSLPVIGALLGHTQPGTTARYTHLFDDPLRAATERVGALVSVPDKLGGT